LAGLARRFEPLPGLRRVRIVGTLRAGVRVGHGGHGNPAGESSGEFLRLDFNRRVMVQFRGSVVTCDAGLLTHRELDDALGLTMMAGEMLADARTGRNGRDARVGLGVADGNQSLAATFASRPQCGVTTAKEISYVKNARLVRLGPRFR